MWQGHYYDGLTAKRHDVTVKLATASIQIIKDDQTVINWPFDEITLAHGHLAGSAMRLERSGETLNILSKDFPSAFKAASPKHKSGWGTPKEQKKTARFILLIFAIPLFLVSLYLWIIPFAANYAADTIPPQWEASLGESVVEGFTDNFKQCAKSEISKPIDAIVARLDDAAQPHPYKFKIHIIESPMVNAFAAPGGHIIIFTGLIEKTETPEELAGVLAHEMQHVLKRHATKSILQNLSTYALITLLTSGSSNTAGMVSAFATMRYSRLAEAEADDSGLKLLKKAQIDPNGMVAFFKTIEKDEKGKNMQGIFSYLSTHPDTAERIDSLNAAINASPYTPTTLLPDTAWKEAVQVCSGGKKNKERDDVYDVEDGEEEDAPKTK